MSKITLHPTPIPGIPVIEPEVEPTPGQEIVGYELIKSGDGFFRKPEPKRMSKVGWFSVIALVICFWPCACVPCVTTCSYETVQRPVYGTPVEKVIETVVSEHSYTKEAVESIEQVPEKSVELK